MLIWARRISIFEHRFERDKVDFIFAMINNLQNIKAELHNHI